VRIELNILDQREPPETRACPAFADRPCGIWKRGNLLRYRLCVDRRADTDSVPDRRFAADYLAKADEFAQERKSLGRGETLRTLIVAGLLWGALGLLTGGNQTVIAVGWLAGLGLAVLIPFVGRWIVGEPWNDPRETRLAAARAERQENMTTRGRWATDPEILSEARERATRKGEPFPGSGENEKN
jgi:hypothetical protein